MTDKANDTPGQPVLQIIGVDKCYVEGAGKKRCVLRGANLALAPGERAAILGKSGSGKTTLLNLVSGIDAADAGEVRFKGASLTGMSERERTLFRRRNIGFIFQFFNLIPTLTVWENLTLPLELNGLFDPDGARRARRLLDEVGLTGREKAFPDRLSGGEQQRVAIARGLVHDPALLLADEPTGNLDEETGKSILRLLDELTRAGGKNMILVTHSYEAASITDAVFRLRDGRLFSEELAG